MMKDLHPNFRPWVYRITNRCGLAFLAVFFLAHPLLAQEALAGRLIVFNSAGLFIPLKAISQAFMKRHPGVDVRLESGAARDCAIKISNMKRPCDVMVSADDQVITRFLFPDHADWSIPFAANEMAVAYHGASRRRREVTETNWFEILSDRNVRFGRANPDTAPAGYGSIVTMQLAEQYYKRPGLFDALRGKDTRFIRPRVTDLLALLESHAIDYAFTFRAVAEQHGLDYVALPDPINLGCPDLADHYRTAVFEMSGRVPGEKIAMFGSPLVCGITIPRGSPNPKVALAFVEYVLTADEGMAVIVKCGQRSVVPATCETWSALPTSLKRFALPKKP